MYLITLTYYSPLNWGLETWASLVTNHNQTEDVLVQYYCMFLGTACIHHQCCGLNVAGCVLPYRNTSRLIKPKWKLLHDTNQVWGQVWEDGRVRPHTLALGLQR